MRQPTRPAFLRYGFVLVVVTAALLLRLATWPILGPELPFLFLWPAVMCCAWYGGFGPGLLATFLSALDGRYFLLEPLHSLAPVEPADGIGLVLYLLLGISISFLIEGLHRARRQVEEHDRRKDEFLAMLAHELRNPLAAISNSVVIGKYLGASDPRLLQATAVIDRQTQFLRHLVEDLLDVTRISRGKISLTRQAVELAEIIRRALEICRPLLEERRHDFTVSLPEEPIRLNADPGRLTQVVVNLLTNAAKYTDEGGRIALQVQQMGGQAVLRVMDNGIGIAPEMLPRVFDLYAQSQQALPRAQGGLGIGLRLVRFLVELHGGTVEALSAGPGKGSEFIVRLPAINPAEEWGAAGAAPAPQQTVAKA